VENDIRVCQGLVRGLHARLAAEHPDWPLLALPDLRVGVDPVPGPGSEPVSYVRVRRLVLSTCRAVRALGARRVVLMTFHGSPHHGAALEAGAAWLRRQGVQAVAPVAPLLLRLIEQDGGEYADLLTLEDGVRPFSGGHVDDFHAGLMETSLALHLAPDSVHPRYRDLPPCPALPAIRPLAAAAAVVGRLGARRLARELAFAASGLAWFRVRPFPGYSGSPHRASAALGAALTERLTADLADLVTGAFAGRTPPRPLLGWLPWVTLGGRVGEVRVPERAWAVHRI
jgi:creatinine amidohydrolase/Fe(II)-dependent formamide hydrolase-like protein